MQLKRQELGNGVFLNYIPTDKFKSGLLQLRFIMPLSKDTAAKNALVFPVIRRGTEKFPNMTAMRKGFQSLYDSSVGSGAWKYGDAQIISLESRPLAQKYAIDDTDIVAGVIDMMEDMLLHPLTENGVFKAEYVAGEKKIAADGVRAIVNNKNQYAVKRCKEIMFSGEPFGVHDVGEAEDIEAVCPTCLWEQYKTLISRARVEIFAVGEFDEDYLAKRFSAIFSQTERKDIYDVKTEVVLETKGEVKTVYERQNVGQGKLVLGFRTGASNMDDDFYVMSILNEIFGGSTSSKLFMNVRERLSLCYYCSSGLIAEKGGMLVSSGIEFKNEQKTVDEITAQLDKIKNGEISDDELGDAKKSQRDNVLRTEDSTGAIAGWYFNGIMRGKTTSPEERMAQYESVTKEQVVEKAKKIKLDTYYFLCGQEETK